MAVAFGTASAFNDGGGVTTISTAGITTTVSDTLVLVLIVSEAAKTFTVTFGGNSCSQIATISDSSGSTFLYLFGQAPPTVGTGIGATATWTGATGCGIACASFTGSATSVAAAVPSAHLFTQQSSDTTLDPPTALSISTTSGDMAFALSGGPDAIYTAMNGGGTYGSNCNGSGTENAWYGYEVASGTTTTLQFGSGGTTTAAQIAFRIAQPGEGANPFFTPDLSEPYVSRETRDQFHAQRDRTWVSFFNPTQMKTGKMPIFAHEAHTALHPVFKTVYFNRNWDYSRAAGLAVKNPFAQHDWPLPIAPPRLPFGTTYARAYPQQQKPFAQTDWPLPTPQARSALVPDRPASTFFVTTTPFFQTDWPLPTPPWRQDKNYAFNYNPTQMQTGQEPFAQLDWPVPVPPARQPDLRTHVSYYNAGQMQSGTKPFSQADWPLSTPPPPQPDLRTGIDYFNPTQMQTGTEPFSQKDWPLPGTPFQFNRSYDVELTIEYGRPFFQTDWPLPTAPRRADETWTWNYNSTQMQTGTQPFSQSDWPVPVQPFRMDRTWISPGIISIVNYPFNVYDWPLAVRPPRLDATWVNFYNPSQLSTGAKPFAQTEWPIPTPRSRLDATWTWPSITAAAKPFAQYDWPLPVRVAYRDYNYTYYFVFSTFVQPPFAQYDWPLPVVSPRLDATWMWPSITSVVVPYPFNQYNWPLPIAPPRIDQTLTFSYNVTQMATGTKPFSQIDWPLPQGPNFGNVTTYTQTGPNNPNIYTPPAPTTVKIEWLIRARRRGRR
jgi:hypothetical protein